MKLESGYIGWSQSNSNELNNSAGDFEVTRVRFEFNSRQSRFGFINKDMSKKPCKWRETKNDPNSEPYVNFLCVQFKCSSAIIKLENYELSYNLN